MDWTNWFWECFDISFSKLFTPQEKGNKVSKFACDLQVVEFCKIITKAEDLTMKENSRIKCRRLINFWPWLYRDIQTDDKNWKKKKEKLSSLNA